MPDCCRDVANILCRKECLCGGINGDFLANERLIVQSESAAG